MKVKPILSIIAFMLMFGAFGQNNAMIDSLENVLLTTKEDSNKVNCLTTLSKQYRNISNFEKAMQHAESALALADKINYKRGKASAYNLIGNLYRYTGNFGEALKNSFTSLKISEEFRYKKVMASSYNNIGIIYSFQGKYAEALENYFACLKIKEESGNKKDIASCYNNIGGIYMKQGKYAEAMGNYFASLKIYEEIGYKMGIANSHNNIGNIYQAQSQYAEALENHFASLKIWKELGDKYSMASSYNNIGVIYGSQAKYEEALENYLASLKISEEIGDKQGIGLTYINIGHVYELVGNYPEALENYLAALKICEEIGDKEGIADSYNRLGSLNIHLGNFQQARKYMDDGLALSKKIGNKSDIQYGYESLARLDSVEGNFAQSLAHYKMYTIYKDSLLNEESNNQISRMKIQYETEKKDREIVLLNKDKELQEQQLEKQRLVRNGIIAGTALLLLVGLLLFRSFRLQKKLEKQQAIIQERNRISADLHDDFGSSISEIFLLSDIVMREATTAATKKAAAKIADNSRHLLEGTGEIIWALNSNNDYLENLVSYIRRYAAEYFENSPVKLKITTPVNMANTHISAESRRNIFYTVKEALHNIIKHAQATEAELKFIVEKEVLSIIIKDNGRGMPTGELNRFGNGLNNMRSRMKSIHGDFNIHNHLGTKITLALPVG